MNLNNYEQGAMLKDKSTNQRIIGLDVLRILLAFLIYLFHSRIHLLCDYGIFNDFVVSGSIAMSAFFMLSGYSLQLTYGKISITKWMEGGKNVLPKAFHCYLSFIYCCRLVVCFNECCGRKANVIG